MLLHCKWLYGVTRPSEPWGQAPCRETWGREEREGEIFPLLHHHPWCTRTYYCSKNGRHYTNNSGKCSSVRRLHNTAFSIPNTSKLQPRFPISHCAQCVHGSKQQAPSCGQLCPVQHWFPTADGSHRASFPADCCRPISTIINTATDDQLFCSRHAKSSACC